MNLNQEGHKYGCCCQECSRNLTGNKYNRELSKTEIAKKVRQEIKEAIAKGELPKELKVSVITKYFSGGSSIDIFVKELGFNPFNLERIKNDLEHPYDSSNYGLPIYNEQYEAVDKKLEGFLNAYNFDYSRSEIDYFHVNFYGNVELDWEACKAWREEAQGKVKELATVEVL